MKKMITALLASTMCLTLFPVSAFADDITTVTTEEENSVDWEKTNQTLALMESGEYPVDFDGDGKVTYFDASAIAEFYAEIQTNNIDADGNVIVKSELSDETRKLVRDYGNIAADDKIDALDAAIFLRDYVAKHITLGDVNYDGTIDSIDASEILSAYAKKQANGEDYTDQDRNVLFVSGDFNGDGVTDALDASDILAVYASAQTK
jgi:hypothetical protein